MKRLTINCPDNNLDAALNLFYIKGSETWVRGGGDGPDYPDIRLYDFIRKAAKILLPDLDFSMDDDGVDYAMGELLLDGPDEPTGLLALLYTAAWSYAELRGRLMQYEDTGLTPERCAEFARADAEGRYIVMRDAEQEGVARLRELAEADKEGRLFLLPLEPGRPMLCQEYFERPWVMKNVTLCVQYKSSAGIIFYMGYDVFRGLVERGRITPLSQEGEEMLEGKANV